MKDNLILLVEDDPQDCELTCLALDRSQIQCDVDVVHHGAELIDYLFSTGTYSDRDNRRQPQLILLDLKMPKLDGLQVLRMLRRTRTTDGESPPPVIVLTSSDERQDISAAYALGANSYIRKPIDFERFTETIQQVADYWLNLNVLPPQAECPKSADGQQ